MLTIILTVSVPFVLLALLISIILNIFGANVSSRASRRTLSNVYVNPDASNTVSQGIMQYERYSKPLLPKGK